MSSKELILVVYSFFLVSSCCAQTLEEMELPTIFSGIPKASAPPVMDGDLGEWNLSGAIFVSHEPTQPLFDCSGVFYMMWDEGNLYFAAKVYDDGLVQGKTGDAIWQEDDVQFDLDLDREGDRKIFDYNDDDFQIAFSPGGSAVRNPRYSDGTPTAAAEPWDAHKTP
jgi:hypothetical protein